MNSQTRFPVILSIATGNPQYKIPQKVLADYLCKAPQAQASKGMIQIIFENSKIYTRYFSVPDYFPEIIANGTDTAFFPDDHSYKIPLEVRYARYKKIAFPLAIEVAAKVIQQAGIDKNDVRKLIVVSSTGFFAPGLDCEIVRALDLPCCTEKTIVGFHGCAAVINGLRIANDFVRIPENAGKYALVVCIELSSINANFDGSAGDIVTHSLFSDGCAAAVIGGFSESDAPKGSLAIVDQPSRLLNADSASFITLDLTSNGLRCSLDKEVPKEIEAYIIGLVQEVLDKNQLEQSDIEFWSIHPGGVKIIESVQQSLGLSDEMMEDSMNVLGEYGNMTSPTIMFILKRVFSRHQAAIDRGETGYLAGVAMAFSPGLGVESLVFKQMSYGNPLWGQPQSSPRKRLCSV